MKPLVFLLFLFCSISARAFNSNNVDSIFYLIDSAKNPVNDRMWDIHEESPSLKFYIIQCICLPYESEPFFVYDMTKEKGEIIDRKRLRTFTLSSLPTLIEKARQYSTTKELKGQLSFCLIEPAGKKYILHKVRLVPYYKGKTVDFVITHHDPIDSTKLKKL